MSVADPDTSSSPAFNQLLGVNNNDIAVGFYNDAAGNSHAYTYNIATKAFTSIPVPGAVSAFAAGINDQNDVVGTSTQSSGVTQGWELVNGTVSGLHIMGKLHTTGVSASGVNDLNQIVGFYTVASGDTYGFVDNDGTPVTIKELDAKGFTVVNGINNGGTLVGFYDTVAGDDCATVCNGFVAVPSPYSG